MIFVYRCVVVKAGMKTLIIGYGSTLRCDDGIGYIIAEQLMDEPPSQISDLKSQIDVIARHQLTPDLADAVSPGRSGHLHRRLRRRRPRRGPRDGSEARRRELGRLRPRDEPRRPARLRQGPLRQNPARHLITIGGENFAIGEGLTPTVQAAIPAVYEQVRRLVVQWTRAWPPVWTSYNTAMNELVFQVEEDMGGGSVARALGEAIFTQGETRSNCWETSVMPFAVTSVLWLDARECFASATSARRCLRWRNPAENQLPPMTSLPVS